MLSARQLATIWLELPLHDKIKISDSLGRPDFKEDEESRQPIFEWSKLLFRWVKTQNKQKEFALLVEKTYQSYLAA